MTSFSDYINIQTQVKTATVSEQVQHDQKIANIHSKDQNFCYRDYMLLITMLSAINNMKLSDLLRLQLTLQIMGQVSHYLHQISVVTCLSIILQIQGEQVPNTFYILLMHAYIGILLMNSIKISSDFLMVQLIYIQQK